MLKSKTYRIIAMLVILVMAFFVSSERIKAESSALAGSESILGFLRTKAQLDVGQLRTMFVVGDKVFTNSANVNGSTNKLKVLDASTLEEHWSLDDSWHVYRGSEGEDPGIILTRVRTESFADLRIYDTDGNFLFAKDKFRGFLFSSPHSQYFYSDFSPFTSNAFKVFDREGNDLLPDFQPSGIWSAYAFNDSIIILSTTSEIQFISFKEGNILASIPAPDSPIGVEPMVKILQSGSAAIINWFFTTLYIDSKFEVTWTRNNEMTFYDAIISSDAKYVALLLGKTDPITKSTIKMRLLLLESKSGRELWNEEFSHPIGTSRYRNQGMKFINGILQLIIPYSDNIDVSNLDPSTQTHLYKYNMQTGALESKLVLQGLVEVAFSKNAFISVSLQSGNGSVIESKWWTSEKH